jgi:hypothetical protein
MVTLLLPLNLENLKEKEGVVGSAALLVVSFRMIDIAGRPLAHGRLSVGLPAEPSSQLNQGGENRRQMRGWKPGQSVFTPRKLQATARPLKSSTLMGNK